MPRLATWPWRCCWSQEVLDLLRSYDCNESVLQKRKRYSEAVQLGDLDACKRRPRELFSPLLLTSRPQQPTASHQNIIRCHNALYSACPLCYCSSRSGPVDAGPTGECRDQAAALVGRTIAADASTVAEQQLQVVLLPRIRLLPAATLGRRYVV